MRKFIIRNFIGSYNTNYRLLRVLALVFFIPSTFAIFCLVNTWESYRIGIVFTILSAICYFLPIGNKLNSSYPRAGKTIYLLLLITACVWFKFEEYDIQFPGMSLIWLPLLLSFWFSFSGYSIGYFDLWPPKFKELDSEQKKDIFV